MTMSTETKTSKAAELKAAWKKAQAEEKTEQTRRKKEYETMRDKFLDTTFSKMFELSQAQLAFKSEAVKLGLEVHDKMYEAYGREKREGIDHYSLVSSDGLRKVTIERKHICAYDETVEVGIQLVRDVLRDKFAERSKKAYRMLESVLMKNKKGDYDEAMVAKLRKHAEEVDNDPRFIEALDIIGKAYKPTGTSQLYLRAYRKETADGRWIDIPMNWSSM